ncbi:MAG: RluA family pseudouridine synthase [Anaerolineae bacterium]|nr:RluA family pseudouridine synthase [Anaerolineae bacterium]
MTDHQVDLTLDLPGERLDRALVQVLPQLSRTAVQKLIKEGQVLVDGRVAKASQQLEGGEQVQVTLPEPVNTDLVPDDIPLDIRYEDDDLLVVNKPAGMVVHPGTGHYRGTLVNAVLAHCPDVLGVGYEKRPGIVHRLDKYTSGLIVVAKNDRAIHVIQSQFKRRTVDKRYLALVEGRLNPPEALIDAPIGRNKQERKKMAVIPLHQSATSRPAQTRYRTLTNYDGYTLVECHPLTGRTHQIRVHMAYIGFPIVGDNVYGRARMRTSLGRHFLHAAYIAFKRPSDYQEIICEAELPPELTAYLEKLVTGD